MNKANITTADRKVVAAANEIAEKTGTPAAAIELSDGTVITGKTKQLLGAASSLVLNALKYLAKIDDELELIPSDLIEPVQSLKVNYLGSRNPRLHVDEILVALSVAAATNRNAAKALSFLPMLKGAQVHCSVILSGTDSKIFSKLGIDLTTEPDYENDNLYHI